ncbi:glycosyltransferase [Patulibacter americanus]|uniref:glycosyltransferase n=1 Tax=Patulibacter americanus TaxID=588672 RepID=UPI0003B52E6C|nr:glycosyltransferase [Patulibacter americanus]
MSPRARVVILRGHQANPWELRPWTLLEDRFDVVVPQPLRGDGFATDGLGLQRTPIRTLRDVMPRGRVGDLLTRLPGDRYVGLEETLRGADIVHTQELGYWYSAQAAKLRDRLGYRLVANVWETLPFADAYRNIRTRPYRRAVLRHTDLFLPATARARDALLVEGVTPDRLEICAPGVDTARFRPAGPTSDGDPVVLSAGRLVWEKGHQDLLRAVALLQRRGAPRLPRVVIVGSGPEDERLRSYAAELGIADRVTLRSFVPYDEMPGVYSSASALWLGSMPIWSWEEQFGMVLAEAHAAGLPIVTTTSGAIPEVAGPEATYVAPGDWVGLADALGTGLLAQDGASPHRVRDPERVREFSVQAAADRLAAAYDRVLATR